MGRRTLTLLDSSSWIEVHEESRGGFRAEVHTLRREASLGTVTHVQAAMAETVDVATRAVLAGTVHDGRVPELLSTLERRWRDDG